MEAFNRRDIDAAVSAGHPDFEYYPPREFVEMGFMEPCYRGAAGFRKFVSAWSDVFGADLREEHGEGAADARRKRRRWSPSRRIA